MHRELTLIVLYGLLISTTTSNLLLILPVQNLCCLSQTHSSFHPTPNTQCLLLSADGRPIRQAGSLDLTLFFSELPNQSFVHSFIVADIAHPILGLDFLTKYKFTIDIAQQTVSTLHSLQDTEVLPTLQPVDYSSCSSRCFEPLSGCGF